MDLRGKPYLQVAHRLVWVREESPQYSIETEFPHVGDTSAMAKATIRDESGRVLATSHKTETAQGFADFIEKAETGAIGRALALIGYGTQFCADELDEGARIVDSPIARVATKPPAIKPSNLGGSAGVPVCSADGTAMLKGKYNPNEFYCPKCKAKRSAA